MPIDRQLRRAPWLLAWAAATPLLAGCGLDGSDRGVQALPSATTHQGASSGAGAEMALELEMAPESSSDQSPGVGAITQPPHLAQASLPPHQALPEQLPGSVAVVGDSLTESAQAEITAYLSRLGIDVLMIDAAENRRMTRGDRPEPGIDIVARIADVADPDLWIIALGTNDIGAEVSPEQFGGDVEALLAAIPADAPVVWVDIWIRDRHEQVVSANDVLRSALGDRPDSIVADWFTHGDDPGIVGGDGVHLTRDGRYVFAATIAAATVDLFE